MSFPKDFLWGAASSAYQIEGACSEDGKGMSIWDSLSDSHIAHEENGNIACDHYHRYKEDISLMKEMGLKAYRFSISWSRIVPEEGKVNKKGVDFYNKLVRELINSGIEPVCTLFHYDMPMWLYEKGGWFSGSIPYYFEQYVKIIVESLSDKVSYWITVNEPACFIGNGYITGKHAPFRQCPDSYHSSKTVDEIARLSRNVLLSHGYAVQTIRRFAKKSPKIGMALNGHLFEPENPTKESIYQAEASTFDKDGLFDSINWWADPMILNVIPPKMKPFISRSDSEIICQPLDFFGFNCYYSNNYDKYTMLNGIGYPGMPRNSMGWPITPDALYWAARFIYAKYSLPVMITENGMSNLDFVMSDGRVHDPQRIEFMKLYIKGLEKAINEGIPVIGYMYWSILDNFEWDRGYDHRFGLIYVDYRTQKRIKKDSYYWYADMIPHAQKDKDKS